MQQMASVEIALACPMCGEAARFVVVEGGEQEPSVMWTDGYREIGGRPPDQQIGRCHACRALYWIEGARHAGETVAGNSAHLRVTWPTASLVEPADEDSYYEALDSGLATLFEQELALRVLAWWRGNDRFRKSRLEARYPTERRAIGNLERLIALCARGDHEVLLTSVEALRQLARFDEASEALSGLCRDYDAAGRRFAALIAARSRNLEILFD
jgi:hypothetical protein